MHGDGEASRVSMCVSVGTSNKKQDAPALTLDVRWRDNPPPCERAAELAWRALEKSSAATSGKF